MNRDAMAAAAAASDTLPAIRKVRRSVTQSSRSRDLALEPNDGARILNGDLAEETGLLLLGGEISPPSLIRQAGS
jgi:hypothetical protein